jgi:hypothetical protein
MPSLLGNLKLDTPIVARQPKVKHLHGYARDGIVALHGCVATVAECFPLGQLDVVRGRQYTTVS